MTTNSLKVGMKKKSFATCLDILSYKFASSEEASLLVAALTIQGEILIADANTLSSNEPKGIYKKKYFTQFSSVQCIMASDFATSTSRNFKMPKYSALPTHLFGFPSYLRTPPKPSFPLCPFERHNRPKIPKKPAPEVSPDIPQKRPPGIHSPLQFRGSQLRDHFLMR